MGRSVNYLSRSDAVAYIAFDDMYRRDECYDCEGSGSTYRSAKFIGPLLACDVCEATGEPDDMAMGPDEHDWDSFMDGLVDCLQDRYPSLYETSDWPERECRTFLANDHCIIAVSEYCGLVSVSLRSKDGDGWDDAEVGLHRAWTRRVIPGFHKLIEDVYGEYALRRMGGFSDGTSVYQRVVSEKLSA